jgi:hypothetical protein
MAAKAGELAKAASLMPDLDQAIAELSETLKRSAGF